MLQNTVQSQIETIRKATHIASKSRESALQFLIDARIIKETKATKKKLMSFKSVQ